MTTVDGRTIGLAHYAGRALAERVLDRHRLAFLDHLALRAAHTADLPPTPEELAARLTADLKEDPARSRRAVDSLVTRGHLEFDGPGLRPSPTGRALFATATAEVAEVSARIYAGLSEEELTAAGRVLEQVTRRANAELAALGT
ncbi:MarR family transcriptional regulator [Streptomyces sp. NPDC004539]|uniref:MarR family transcriptional regulator n=1 Tax=Streptomyces sp. NPDC004539 TaxID=3154280 RepID=UPI00339E636D